MARSKVKSRSHLQPPTNVPTKYQLPTPYGCSDKYRSRSLRQGQKVTSWSHHDIAHLQPSTNVSFKYQLPTPYGFQDIAQTRFYRSRSLQQGQWSNQGHTMTCTPTLPNQCPYQVSTSYTFWFLRYIPYKIF